jgi:hypothetical protein
MTWAGQDRTAWAGQEAPAAGTDPEAKMFDITGLTPVNGSLGTITQDGDEISFNFTANTISNTPATALYVEAPLEDVFGDVSVADLIDFFKMAFKVGVLVPPTDMHVGMALVTAGDATGFAVRVAAVAGDWQGQHLANAAASWGGAWTASTSDGDTQAAAGWYAGPGNATAQARIGAIALDSAGVAQGGATATSPQTTNIGNGFTHIRLFAGWIAGGVGTVPASIVVKASHFHGKFAHLFARLFQ